MEREVKFGVGNVSTGKAVAIRQESAPCIELELASLPDRSVWLRYPPEPDRTHAAGNRTRIDSVPPPNGPTQFSRYCPVESPHVFFEDR